ncbi:hypothetical protein Tco_0804116 [Tanacetum coccineum]|uniref:Uncharacterized protein n=1 Tax=Tanacetum coccineum TaxID=301880 RepID=A0ABQ5A7T9_9ASTR
MTSQRQSPTDSAQGYNKEMGYIQVTSNITTFLEQMAEERKLASSQAPPKEDREKFVQWISDYELPNDLVMPNLMTCYAKNAAPYMGLRDPNSAHFDIREPTSTHQIWTQAIDNTPDRLHRRDILLAGSTSKYNVLLGRRKIQKLSMKVSTIRSVVKFPMEEGLVTIKSKYPGLEETLSITTKEITFEQACWETTQNSSNKGRQDQSPNMTGKP